MLKKVGFLALSTVLTTLVFAQPKKGDKMVGATVGSIFFNNGSSDLTSTVGRSTTSSDKFGITLTPSYGWFISDNTAIGIAPTIGYNKQKTVGKSATGSTYLKDETSVFNFSIGGFARYYFKGSNTMRFFGQYNVAAGLSGSKTEGF